MLTSSTRLLRLLALLQTRNHWMGPELAERLEVHPRTLRRDIDRLRQLGYPVHASSGVAGGYAFRAGQALPPLLLDDDEALAVSIALRTATAGAVGGIEEPALRALVKLEQAMPARLRQQVDALRSTILPMDRVGPVVDASLLATLASACRDQLRLAFTYGDSKGRSAERSVAPHAEQARIVLHAPYQEMARRIPQSAGVVSALDEGQRCQLDCGANDSLVYWLMALDVEFEVLAPVSLKERLRVAGERALRCT